MNPGFASVLRPHSKRFLGFFGFVAVATILAADLVARLTAYALANQTASHVLLVPFVSLALLWLNRDAVFADIRCSWLGAPLLVVGLALQVWAIVGFAPSGTEFELSFGIAGLALVWVGGFLVFFGPAAGRAAHFPLAFLLLTIPIPPAILDGAIAVLRAGSADGVAALFTLTATPHYRAGFVFELPSLAIEIADECSGIRSSIALLLTSLLAGHVYLDASWKKLTLVAVAIPVAMLKNAIRIVTLSLLAVHVDRSFLSGELHRDGGVVFFLFAIVLLVPVVLVLRRCDTTLHPRKGLQWLNSRFRFSIW